MALARYKLPKAEQQMPAGVGLRDRVWPACALATFTSVVDAEVSQ